MLKKLIATIAITICCLADPLPVRAQHQIGAYLKDNKDHRQLVETISNLGVVVLVNHKFHCIHKEFAGLYYDNGVLVICQDNRPENNGIEVKWTDNDLDTLRHEAHHIVQDCALGTIADGKMSRMFVNEEEYFDFVEDTSLDLVKLYTKLREMLNEEETLIEIEAYVVAKDIPVEYITKKIVKFCN